MLAGVDFRSFVLSLSYQFKVIQLIIIRSKKINFYQGIWDVPVVLINKKSPILFIVKMENVVTYTLWGNYLWNKFVLLILHHLYIYILLNIIISILLYILFNIILSIISCTLLYNALSILLCILLLAILNGDSNLNRI